jgi:iron complex transport system substrate-binding protein
MQRIVSFLPSATEMVYALGLGDSLVGVTHECDYPAEAKTKPVVVRNALPIETMSQSEIDRAVAERLQNGSSLYQIDEQLLCELAPDLILTQNLCQVCAPSGNEVSQVLKTLPQTPEILWLSPQTLNEIFDNVHELGKATQRSTQAIDLIDSSRARLDKLRAVTTALSHRPRVFCMEWLDPVYATGHWVPELASLAGGEDRLGRNGANSVRVSWQEIADWAPEILVIMPCGYNLQQTMKQVWSVFGPYGASSSSSLFFELPAVRAGRVFAVDANAYFARPGPRVVEGAELLAHLFHPGLFPVAPDASLFQPVDVSLLQGTLSDSSDYNVEEGAMVFTADYLKRRGYCCDSGCRNCPY